ncbi:MAG: DNA polymerase III subunit gamma/tau [Minisyncoccia bacterium]
METLYRKYRPQKFAQVIGQDHVVSVLEASIKKGNISHAYLFSGSRGTGKTSIARILANEIGTHENDVYEMDAASQNSVDDVRALVDGVNTMPFQSKYKVYILDEAHMFSKQAWNALLKTLEEPPAHVIFVLATTELEKVPETVISRCQTFTFKKPSEAFLKDVINDASKKEGKKLNSDAAELIALLGDGSYRDAYGILQKVITVSDDKEITGEEVEKVTGAPKHQTVNEVLLAISKGDSAKALEAIGTASKAGTEIKTFLKLLIYKMRAILLLRFDPRSSNYLSDRFSKEDIAILSEIAKEKTSKINASSLLEILNAYSSAGRFVVPELPLELALMRILGEDK